MSLDVLKGLGVGPHQRMMFWAIKNEVSLPRKRVCVRIFQVCTCTLDSCVRITYFSTALMARLQTVITNSSKLGKICIQIEAQDVYFPMKQTLLKKYLWSQSYGQNSKKNVIFQYCFQSYWSAFESSLLPNNCELFNYPWLTYIKLIIGAGDQNLLMGTK